MHELEESYRDEVTRALQARDAPGAHRWAKGWIGRAEGQWILDPWLVYAASAVLEKQPRMAVRSCDQALRGFIAEAADRAVLRWVRGEVIRARLLDPKTALEDLEVAARDAPDWLRDEAVRSLERARLEAAASRKRKASVDPAPGLQDEHAVIATRPRDRRPAGQRPPIWDVVVAILCG